jgi:acyl-[acyl-carrier-protein]-phospholipid O-acyltransferase / long-chain-fatty-acid--[acyl-carrier-protein] ligase
MIKSAKFLLRCLLRLLYGVKVSGMENYHETGERVLIVANHTSLLDGLLLYAWLPDTPTFAINTRIAQNRKFKPFLKFVDLFIMDPSSPLSIKSMIKFIRNNNKAVIFPEGRITTTGSLMKIYEGPALVADKANAMILPVALEGCQYSPFSYLKGSGNTVWFPRISITVLPPEKVSIPENIQGHARRKAAALMLQRLMYKLIYTTYDYQKTVFTAVLEAAKQHRYKSVVLEDINREPLNYRQLISRTFILAREIKKDTSAREYVGLLLPNVTGAVVSYLALQFLGRVPAMLNYSAGIQVLLGACETAQIKTVFTSHKFIENAALTELATELEKHVNVVYLEDMRTRISVLAKLMGLARSYYPQLHYRLHRQDNDPDEPATILFTSGSEGMPKGVVLSHINLLSNYAQGKCYIDYGPRDVMFNCLPLFHCFGLNVGCLMPLLAGSRTFLYPTPLHYRIIPELIYELGATIFFAANTFLKGYAHHAHPYDFHSIRYALAGAEKLRDDTQKIWMEKFGIRILQGYGVTETSPVIAANTPMTNRTDTIGHIIPGMEYHIEPVDGIEHGGRLIVKGPNVMLGYLIHGSDGEIKPPVASCGEGWHDTGDIASIDEDGFISILGRAKRFAKIGGEMVSLLAVEELAMHAWPDFNHAAVNLPDERKGEKIVLITTNQNANRKQIQEIAKQLKYGEIYIPKKVVRAEELPLLSTGKIDYVTLTEMALAEDQSGSGWINKLANLVGKPGSLDAGQDATDDDPKSQSLNTDN